MKNNPIGSARRVDFEPVKNPLRRLGGFLPPALDDYACQTTSAVLPAVTAKCVEAAACTGATRGAFAFSAAGNRPETGKTAHECAQRRDVNATGEARLKTAQRADVLFLNTKCFEILIWPKNGFLC